MLVQHEQAVKRLETAIDDGIVNDVDDALQSVDVTELEDDDASFIGLELVGGNGEDGSEVAAVIMGGGP